MLWLRPTRGEKIALKDKRLQGLRGLSFKEAWPRILAVWSSATSLVLGPFGFPGVLLEEYLLLVYVKHHFRDSEKKLFSELGRHGPLVDAYIVEALRKLDSPLLRDLPATIFAETASIPRLKGCSCASVPLGVRAKEVLDEYRRDHPIFQCRMCGHPFACTLEFADGFRYAYCSDCGMAAFLDANLDEFPGGRIDASHERHFPPCQCGGRFETDATPKCPACRTALPATDFGDHYNLDAIGDWDADSCLIIDHRFTYIREMSSTG
jgi:hypothetical protein